jgi:hypothetical protein
MMKFGKNGWLITTLALSLMIGVGCSKDDEDDSGGNNQTQGPKGSDLNESQQQVVIASSNQLAFQSIGFAASATSYLQGGGFGLQGNGNRELDEPPSGWEGPDGQGWYHQTEQQSQFDVYIKFTPDIWADNTQEATRVDLRYELHDVSQGQADIEYNYWAEYNNDRTLVSGAYAYDYTYSQQIPGQPDWNFSYHQGATWSGVTVDPNDYAGHFTTSGTSIVVNDMGQPTTVMIAGTFDFNADGTGTGSTSIGGEEFIRYVFASVSPISGNFTLKSENWETEHPF